MTLCVMPGTSKTFSFSSSEENENTFAGCILEKVSRALSDAPKFSVNYKNTTFINVSIVMLIYWGWQADFAWKDFQCFLKMLSHVHLLLGLLLGTWSSVLPVSFMCGWGAVSDWMDKASAHPYLWTAVLWKGKVWRVPCRWSPAQQLSDDPHQTPQIAYQLL